MPHTLVQKFGVAAVRGVARSKSIAEFQLQPTIDDPQVVDSMLAQLTPDERRRFRVEAGYFSSIKLCPVGEWSLSVSSCSVCAVSSPQSVVPEKQPLPPQLAVHAGWSVGSILT